MGLTNLLAFMRQSNSHWIAVNLISHIVVFKTAQPAT
jgi:hypothetical protein